MSRWEPNASGRLVEAAMALFKERGYDATTVAEIAARAGLTERTFFRYFTDKREVLFFGSDRFEAAIVAALVAAPLPAMAAVMTALHAIDKLWSSVPDHAASSRRRHALIEKHAELQERELIKLAALSDAMTRTLRRRGVKEARLAAETGVGVLKVAFERWVTDAKRRAFAVHLDETAAELKALARYSNKSK